MKKQIINIIAIVVLAVVVASMASCKKDKIPEPLKPAVSGERVMIAPPQAPNVTPEKFGK